MSSKIKKWCYWLTVVGPISDILYGAICGIANAWKNAREERAYEERCRVYDEELAQFRKDNYND